MDYTNYLVVKAWLRPWFDSVRKERILVHLIRGYGVEKLKEIPDSLLPLLLKELETLKRTIP
jgi:hypothetical protein